MGRCETLALPAALLNWFWRVQERGFFFSQPCFLPPFLQAETCVTSIKAPLAAKGNKSNIEQPPQKPEPPAALPWLLPLPRPPSPLSEEKSRLQYPTESKI